MPSIVVLLFLIPAWFFVNSFTRICLNGLGCAVVLIKYAIVYVFTQDGSDVHCNLFCQSTMSPFYCDAEDVNM